MAQSDNVKVQIRIRPLSPAERDSCWTIREQCMFEMSASGKRLNEFTFDHVFTPQQSTHELYNTVARSIVSDVVRGFNGTIFAYGQTGSGKTFTMQGDMLAGGSFPGLIQFALDDLFRVANERSREQRFRVAASYLEIYNETLKDLLNPQQNVKLRTDVSKGVFVEGITKASVNSVQQVLSLLAAGQQNRQVAATNINEHSSRSHTVFSVNIESCYIGREDEGITSSTLSLVDLAGSERIAVSGTDGLRKKEGAHINRSLLAFNNVMQKLAERTPFIPYRDSKLTHILSQSLGGDSKTLIVCTVTPAAVHREVTLATLKFAQRAKMIENKPQVNETLSDKQIIRKLEREVTRLQQQIHEAQKENLPMGVNGQPIAVPPPEKPVAEVGPLEARMARLHSMLESYPTIARRHTYGCSAELPEVEEEMLVHMKNKRVSVGATPQEREECAREEFAELMAQKDQRIQQLEAQLAMERRKKEEEAAWRLRLLQELEEEKNALENDTRRVMQYAIAQAQRRIDRSTDLLHSGVAATMEHYEAFMSR